MRHHFRGSHPQLRQHAPKSGGFHFGELMVPVGPNGAADADTILIDSKYNDGDIKNDLVSCADFAIHEYMHWENCQGGSTEDPTTTDPSCGGCNHAGMHMLHLVAYLERACDGNSEIDYCELAWNNLYAAAQHMNTCDMDCPTFGSTDSILAFLDGGFDQCCE